MDMRRLIDALNESGASVPEPLVEHLLDAIQHADIDDRGFVLEDFEVEYLGLLGADEIARYDDLSSWVEVADSDDLETYRNGSFRDAGPGAALPPVIIITTPEEDGCQTQVGDGRGRINWAVAHHGRLHVYHMIHRDCIGT